MVYTVSITSQGQISIPANIRRELGLNRIKKATVTREGNRIVIEPVKDFFELRGSLHTIKKYNQKEIDEKFGEYLAWEAIKGDPVLRKLAKQRKK